MIPERTSERAKPKEGAMEAEKLQEISGNCS